MPERAALLLRAITELIVEHLRGDRLEQCECVGLYRVEVELMRWRDLNADWCCRRPRHTPQH